MLTAKPKVPPPWLLNGMSVRAWFRHSSPGVTGLTVAAAVVIGALLVVAGLGLTGGLSTRTHALAEPPKLPGDFGPRLELAISSGNGSLPTNNTTITVQIWSAVPSGFASGGMELQNISASRQQSNGFEDRLFNWTDNGSSTSVPRAGFLSPNFDTLAGEWAALLGRDSGSNYPSVTVIGTESVRVGSNLSIYQYYNNLDYNPRDVLVVSVNSTEYNSTAVEGWFNGTGIEPQNYSKLELTDLELPLALEFPRTPSEVIPLANGSAGEVPRDLTQKGSEGCRYATETESCTTTYYSTYPPVTTNTLVHTSFVNGTLPLIGVHIGRNADPGKSEISLFATVYVINDTIELNSVQTTVSATGQTSSTMSTSPSFLYIANATGSGGGGVWSALPTNITETGGTNASTAVNRTTAFAGIQGVEYSFQHYNQTSYNYRDIWERYCCPGPTGIIICQTTLKSQTLTSEVHGGFTDGSIVNINSTAGLQVEASFEPIYVAWVVQALYSSSHHLNVNLTTSGAESSYQASTLWAQTTGYLSAANAFGQAASLLLSFSSALGLGLALADTIAATNGADFDASEPAVVAASLALIHLTIEMTASLLSTFSSISAVTGTNALLLGCGFSNVPTSKAGSGYGLTYFESSNPVTASFDGNSYSFEAPMNYLNATAILG